MTVTIKGKPKEIADFALELQSRQENKTIKNNDVLEEQLKLLLSASGACVKFKNFECLPELTRTMLALQNHC